jgi:hypothetical protein
MDEGTDKTIWQPSATLVVLVLCALWIGATAWARWATGGADPSTKLHFGGAAAVGLTLALILATAVVSRILSTDLHLRVRSGEIVAAVLFAAVAAAHIATDSVTVRDATALWLCLSGVHFASRPTGRWVGITMLGVACGCSPLVGGSMLVVVAAFVRPAGQFIGFAMTLFLAVFFYPMFTPREVPWTYAFPVPEEIERVGPAYLWTLAADWGDIVLPVVVLALLAIAEELFGRPEERPPSPEPEIPRYALRLWLVLNAVAAVCLPRILVSHGLIFMAPAILLAAPGWRLLRCLPFTRSNWTLSLSSAFSYCVVLALVWTPIRTSAELIMSALWVR